MIAILHNNYYKDSIQHFHRSVYTVYVKEDKGSGAPQRDTYVSFLFYGYQHHSLHEKQQTLKPSCFSLSPAIWIAFRIDVFLL